MELHTFNIIRLILESLDDSLFILVTCCAVIIIVRRYIIIEEKKRQIVIPWIILSMTFLLALDRSMSQGLLVVVDVANVIYYQYEWVKYLEQVALGIDMFGYIFGCIIFEYVLTIWIRILISAIDGMTKCMEICIRTISYVVHILAVILAVILLPATIMYLSVQSIAYPNVLTITLFYIAVPYYIAFIVIYSIFIAIIGIYIIVRMIQINKSGCLPNKERDAKDKVAIRKLTIAVVTIPAVSIIRAISTAIYAMDFKYYSYLQSIPFLTCLPDIIIIIVMLCCFAS